MPDMDGKENTVDISFMNIESPSCCENAREIALKALDALEIAGWEVSILFCDDDFIAELNGRYRSKPEPTDVLSFSQYDDEDGFPAQTGSGVKAGEDSIITGDNIAAGDIVISVPALERNASDAGIGVDEELVRLIVHGILHLSGMDHEEQGDGLPANPMLVLQDTIIKKITGDF